MQEEETTATAPAPSQVCLKKEVEENKKKHKLHVFIGYIYAVK